LRIGHITLRLIHREHLPERGQRALQLEPDLTILAG
jgi:hypothetical protein